MTTVQTFDATAIKKISFLFKGDESATIADCVGKLNGTTKMQTVTKKCGKTEVKSITKPISMEVKIQGHVPIELFRKFYGLSKDSRLKPGIYSYGADSVGKAFSLGILSEDEFEHQQQLIGMLNCSAMNGLKFTIENGADTIAELELDVKVMVDEAYGKFYYDAFVSDLEDKTLVDLWMSKLKPEILAKTKQPNTPQNVSASTSNDSVEVSAG